MSIMGLSMISGGLFPLFRNLIMADPPFPYRIQVFGNGFEQRVAHLFQIHRNAFQAPFKIGVHQDGDNGDAQTEDRRNQGFPDTGRHSQRIVQPLVEIIEGPDHARNGTQQAQNRSKGDNDIQIVKVVFKLVQGPFCPGGDEAFQAFEFAVAVHNDGCQFGDFPLCLISQVLSGKPVIVLNVASEGFGETVPAVCFLKKQIPLHGNRNGGNGTQQQGIHDGTALDEIIQSGSKNIHLKRLLKKGTVIV